MDNIVKPQLLLKLAEALKTIEAEYCCLGDFEDYVGESNNNINLKIQVSSKDFKSLVYILNGLEFVEVRDPGDIYHNKVKKFLGIDAETGRTVSIVISETIDIACRRPSSIIACWAAVGRSLKAKAEHFFWRDGLTNTTKKFLAPHGKIIAFMGGDGSGKTSNIKEFEKWFGQYFNVRVLHVGKPAKGPMWYGVGVLLKLRKMLLRIRTDHFHESVKHLMVAWYRQRAFQKATSLRSKGFLVALDRFPLPGMEIMEAPQIRRMTGGGGIYDYLAKLEDIFHRGIRGADEIFVLMLDPAIARIRRPEDKPQELKRRCCEILHRDWPDGYAHLIDASRPFDEVVLKIRRLAWNSLKKTSRVVEIIGPAGVGKTSVARKIKESTNSIQTSVSWHDSRLCLIKVLIRRFAKILSLVFRKVSIEIIKEVVGLEVDLEILLKHKNRHLLPCRDVILEVGPIFKITKLKMDGNLEKIKWIDQIYEKANRSLDCLVWMDVPNEILQQRINNRPKKHDIKNKTRSEMFRFIEDYRHGFSTIINSCDANFAVNKLDVSGMTVEEVSETIKQMAFGPEHIKPQRGTEVSQVIYQDSL